MKILITGGTGFIGNHLCRTLCNLNHEVICVDNNFTGCINNIEDLIPNPNFKYIYHDIKEPLYIQEKIDQIYHLACPASPKAYQYNPISTLKINFLGTLNILGLAKHHKATILLSSTSEIYGDPNISPQVESYFGNVNPIGLRSCYDEGKRIAETLMNEYKRSHNVNIRIARIFNTYGPKMNKFDGRVVSNFINQSLKNEKITIYGVGNQTRSFCYVDDTINGLIKLMNSSITEPINIGNPYEITITQLASLIINFINPSLEIKYEDLPEDDPKRRKPDIDKAKKHLNWKPKVTLEEGLKKTIEYFRKNI